VPTIGDVMMWRLVSSAFPAPSTGGATDSGTAAGGVDKLAEIGCGDGGFSAETPLQPYSGAGMLQLEFVDVALEHFVN
jgi:hypothetical protein